MNDRTALVSEPTSAQKGLATAEYGEVVDVSFGEVGSDSVGTKIPGWYIELQATILQVLPRPPQMDKVTAMRLSKNPRELKRILSKLLTPEVGQIELSDKRFRVLESFDLYTPKEHYSNKVNFEQKLKVDLIVVCDMNVTPDDCVKFLKDENALLLGEFGVSLVSLRKVECNKKSISLQLGNRWIASFDENPRPRFYPQSPVIPGLIGENFTDYKRCEKTIEEIMKEGGVSFMFCFRDASN